MAKGWQGDPDHPFHIYHKALLHWCHWGGDHFALSGLHPKEHPPQTGCHQIQGKMKVFPILVHLYLSPCRLSPVEGSLQKGSSCRNRNSCSVRKPKLQLLSWAAAINTKWFVRLHRGTNTAFPNRAPTSAVLQCHLALVMAVTVADKNS